MPVDSIILFIPTIAAISLTPGLCMTLAFTLGLTVGYRRSLWMMTGELAGVSTVFTASFWGLAWLMSLNPEIFQFIAVAGGSYLIYLSITLWRVTPEQISARKNVDTHATTLIVLGYVTAVMNPKGWAFLLALLPGFIDTSRAAVPQFAIMLAIMLTTEFLAMSTYAKGGQWLAARLGTSQGLRNANRVAAGMLLLAALWILTGTVFA